MEGQPTKHGAEFALQKKESALHFKHTTEQILNEAVPLDEKINLVFGSDSGVAFWQGFSQESGEMQLALVQELVRCNLTENVLWELRKLYAEKTCYISKKDLLQLVENEAINGFAQVARSIDLFAEFVSPKLVNSFVARGSYDVVAQVCSKPELLENFASREEALETILERARKDGYFYKIIADNLRTIFTAHGQVVKSGAFPQDGYLKEIFDARYSIPRDPYKPLSPKNQMPECVVGAICRNVDLFGYTMHENGDENNIFYFDEVACDIFNEILRNGTVPEVEELFQHSDKLLEMNYQDILRVARRSKEFEEAVSNGLMVNAGDSRFTCVFVMEYLINNDIERLEKYFVTCGNGFSEQAQSDLLYLFKKNAKNEDVIKMMGRLFIDRPWPRWIKDFYMRPDKIVDIMKILWREFDTNEVLGCMTHMPPPLRARFLDKMSLELSLKNDSENKINPDGLDIILRNCPEKFPIFLNTLYADFDAKYVGSLLERGIVSNEVFEQLYFCAISGNSGIAEVLTVCDSLPHIKPAFRDFLEKELREMAGYWIEKFGL